MQVFNADTVLVFLVHTSVATALGLWLYFPEVARMIRKFRHQQAVFDEALRKAHAETREAEERALNAQLNSPSPIMEPVQVPLIITKKMTQRLHARGYSEVEINQMTPQQAWDSLK